MDKNKLILFDIDHTLFDTETFKQSRLETYSLYEEVFETLTKLSKISRLAIFSQGEFDFQNTKLKNTKIDSFFKKEDIHVFQEKQLNFEEIFKKYSEYKIFVVDDRLDILAVAKKYLPSVSTVWIKRGPHAQKLTKVEGFIPDKEILSLQEILEFIVK